MRTTIMLGSNQYCHDKTYQGRCDRKGLLIHMIERKIKGGQEGKREKEWSVRGRGKKSSEAVLQSTSVSMAIMCLWTQIQREKCLPKFEQLESGGVEVPHRSFDFKVHAYSLLPLNTNGISGHISKKTTLVRTWLLLILVTSDMFAYKLTLFFRA